MLGALDSELYTVMSFGAWALDGMGRASAMLGMSFADMK
jgi:hypothetical protein